MSANEREERTNKSGGDDTANNNLPLRKRKIDRGGGAMKATSASSKPTISSGNSNSSSAVPSKGRGRGGGGKSNRGADNEDPIVDKNYFDGP